MAKVAVIGLGKLGLLNAVAYAYVGHQVAGLDVDQQTLSAIERGVPPFPGEADIDKHLPRFVEAGSLKCIGSDHELSESEVVIIAVPLARVGATLDTKALDSALAKIRVNAAAGSLVIVETTLPRSGFSGLILNQMVEREDLDICYSPSRIYTGEGFRSIARSPKLVGTDSASSARRATAFYHEIWRVLRHRMGLQVVEDMVLSSSIEAVELAKLFEAAYRYSNIALANQLASITASSGLSYADVASLSNTQPFCHLGRPGMGVGGHCLPEYIGFLEFDNDPFRFFEACRHSVSMSIERWIDAILAETVGQSVPAVRILGASYRANIRDLSNSVVFELQSRLAALSISVETIDPYFSPSELESAGIRAPSERIEPTVLVLQATHRAFDKIRVSDYPGLRLFLDPHRGASEALVANLKSAGIRYLSW